MRPFYFGPAEKQLFGVYHPPLVWGEKLRAALLCYPLGLEYIRSHRALKCLAETLAKQGWHVLRFDYRGTGDSSGESHHLSVKDMKDDIRHACRELQSVSGVKRASIVGLRLGGALAAQVSAEGLECESLVLWDPIIDGAQYVRQMESMEQAKADHPHFPRKKRSVTRGSELLGFQYDAGFVDDLRTIDLRTLKTVSAGRSMLVDTEGHWSAKELRFLKADDVHGLQGVSGEAGRWDDLEQAYNTLQAASVVREVARIIA